MRNLLFILLGFIIFRIIRRLFSTIGQKRDYGYTSETPRQEGDVVIERRAENKSGTKVTDDTEYVDFEEVE